jgi:spore germination protein KB
MATSTAKLLIRNQILPKELNRGDKMIEKGKISAFQMTFIMFAAIISTALLLVPGITAVAAKRDLWISPMWASITGFITVYIAYKLNQYYPKKTIIEFSEDILGRTLGKIVGFVYIVYFLHVTGIIIREFGEFIVGTFLTLTPISVIMGAMVLVCAFNVRGGLEVMGRSAQIFAPIVTFLYLAVVILLIPNFDIANMLPVMENGLKPSIMGSLVPQAWFSEFILISFLLPYLSDREKGLKWGMISVLTVMLFMVVSNLSTFFVFGELTSSFVYPVMVVFKFISIADFFEHLESLAMMIWVGGTFVKISIFYYVIVTGTAQWLKLSNYRPLTLPIGLLLVLMSLWLAPGLQQIIHFITTISPFYFLSVETMIPMLLLLISLVQCKKE